MKSLPEDREGARHARRLADLCGLTSLAVAYPTFEVLSRSPEFFVARSTTLTHGVALVVVLVLLLPVLLFCLELLAGIIRHRSAPLVHSMLIAMLSIALVLPWLKRADALADVTGPAALLVGLLFALIHHRSRAARLFVTALAPAVLVVPFVFLSNRDVTRALIRVGDSVGGVEIDRAPPIVLVVFDEFPVSSLLDENHDIDDGRYPNFAALAAESHWYRDAGTVSSETMWALPAILTGSYPIAPGAVPTRRYYPNNLFTVLGDRYEMTAFGRFLQLCPESRCQADPGAPRETIPVLIADIGVVWLHIVLPDALAASLPPVTGDWRAFARARRLGSLADRPDATDPGAEFARFLGVIEKDRDASLYFLHSLLPHMPFTRVPSGRRYEAPDYQSFNMNGERLFEAAGAVFADVLYQRHLLQVGFVDTLIGDLIRRLKEQEIYDEALVIVTADHGASFREGLPRRAIVLDNFSDIALVPLFVKLPGQHEGVVSDDSVQVIDILPTIAEVLSIDLPYDVNGQSLLDAMRPGRGRAFVHRNLTRISIEAFGRQVDNVKESVARKTARLGAHTNERLYGVGRAAPLLGTKIPGSRFEEESATGMTTTVTNLEVSESPPDQIPLYVQGTVTTTGAQPVALAIAVADEIVATTESYEDRGQWRFSSAVPESAFTRGHKKLSFFVVTADGGELALAPVD